MTQLGRRSGWLVLALTLTATAALLVGGCALLQDRLIGPDDGVSLITESEAQAIIDTQRSAGVLYKELVNQGATRVAEQVAEWLLTIPGVAQVVVGDDGNVWVTYDSGLVGVLLSERNSQSTTAELQPTHLDVPFAQEAEPPESLQAASALALQRSQVQLPGSRRAVILAYNKESYDENGGKDAYEALEAMGYTVERYVGEGFTLDRLTGLGAYGVIFFFTHGGLSVPAQLGCTDTITLCTGQRVSGAWELAQLWRHYPGAFGLVYAPDGDLTTLCYSFNPRFITEMMPELPSSLVVAQACSSLKNDSMADAFLRQGAATYLGWTDVSNGCFSWIATRGLLEALSQAGCTVTDALASQVIDFMPGRETESYSIDQLFPAEYCWFDQDNGAYHFLEIDLRIVEGDLSLCKCWTTDFKLKLGEAGDLMLVEPDPVILTLYVHEGSETGPLIPEVRVYGEDAAGTVFDATTNPNGVVTISGIPGEWSINASKPGYLASNRRLNVSTTGIHRVALQRAAAPSPSIAAAITWMSVPTTEMRVGEPMTLDVTVKNTGSSNWTYQVAASLRRPGGSHVHLPLKPLTLSPGELGGVVWTYSPDTAGSWDVAFSIWLDASLETSLATTGWMEEFFSVEDPSTPTLPGAANLYSFGANWGGLLGHGDTNGRATPTRVSGLADVSAAAGGHYHTLVVTASGDVYSFGGNSWGELGHGDVQRRLDPTRITSLSGAVSVAAGSTHSLVLTSNGDVYSFGGNDYGQLGHGDRVERTRPQRIAALSNVVAIAAGMHHSIAITSDGNVYTFGWNGYGQLGHGDTSSRLMPSRTATPPSPAVAAAGGTHHSLVVLQSGDVYSFGSSSDGALGLGSTTQRNTPTRIAGLAGAVSVAAGIHSLVLLSNGDVYAFGLNNVGQLGLGHTAARNTPVRVASVSGATAVAAGHQHSLVLLANGDVLSFGLGDYGALGHGNWQHCHTPTRIPSLGKAFLVAAGHSHSLVASEP